MLNIETIFLFIFVLSILNVAKHLFKFLTSLLQQNPQPMRISSGEVFLLMISISYIITFVIQN